MIDENNKILNLVDNDYIRVSERIFNHTILCTDIEHALYPKDWSPMYIKRCDHYLAQAKRRAPQVNQKHHFVKDRDWYTETV